MKTPTKRAALGAGILALALSLASAPADDKKPAETKPEVAKAAKGEKPAASPGWIIFEEEFLIQWSYEPIGWFHNSEMHLRKGDEQAAAGELRKAEAWLRLASGHAQPNTKKALAQAAKELEVISKDLDHHKTLSQRDLKATIAKATAALAEWHYFKADEKLATSEEKDAAKHLKLAASYLGQAADAARFEYGDEYVTHYDDILGDEESITTGRLTGNLTAMKSELDRLTKTLNKAALEK